MPVHMNQMNSSQQSDQVKEAIPRSEWTRGEQSLFNQLPIQEKSVIDLNARQTVLVPSEGYSRSRLNSLTTKLQGIPSSSQINIIAPTTTQDNRPIGDAKQAPMGPPDGYVRSRLNSLTVKPEPIPVSEQNISIPVYIATIEQPSVPISTSFVNDQKEMQNQETQLRRALESILPSDNTNTLKQPLYDKRDAPGERVTLSTERPQNPHMQTETSHPTVR